VRRTHILPALVAVVAILTGSVGAPAARAVGEGIEMQARVLFEGHARIGAWMAIEVHLRNDGPPVSGELRLSAGAQGRTRYAVPVDLPTQSNKTYLLYGQPPALGSRLDVALISGSATLTAREVEFTVHEASTMVVGVIAEDPQRIVPGLDLLPGSADEPPVVVALGPEDLPDRVEAWAPIDRLVWQDVDSNQLRAEQIVALRGWLASGGRLVIAGGTAGPSLLSAFPDEILPYRPTATVDVPPGSLTSLLASIPPGATDLPALGGELARGRALATVGDRAVAAETRIGSGTVTLIGFDPATRWIADAGLAAGLWRSLLPARSTGPLVLGEDGSMVSAVSQLPALALPPIGGLLALLAAYIVLVGPINYLVLKRLDRREWAWITMPVLIALFAAGSYAFGAALRGLDVIVNEVAVVRGAPDTTEGIAQVYMGVFSPSRGTYQVEFPDGALLSSTQAGELTGAGGSLDLIQGRPSRIRDLLIGFGSLRTLRAETPAAIPRIQSDLRLAGDRLVGTIRNLSDRTLNRPAVVLGGSAIVLGVLSPGGEQAIELPVRSDPFGQALAEKVLGPTFFGNPSGTSEETQRSFARRYMLEQLTCNRQNGICSTLPDDSPVLLAWGTDEILDVRIQGQVPRRTGNVLYYIPLPMGVRGNVAFTGDLIRRSTIEADAIGLSVEANNIYMDVGSATMLYQPVAFEGTLDATSLVLGANLSGELGFGREPIPVEPVGPACDGDDCPDDPPGEQPACDPSLEECEFIDQLPQIELYDRTGDGQWMRLPQFQAGQPYRLDDPDRFVDPAQGGVLVRFVNDLPQGTSFTFQVRIEGGVR
jgi:hypothetical protein